jgi:hypothetical protein
MHYSFKYLWGGSTTRINGRFQIPNYGRFVRWKRYCQVAELNNRGERFGLRFLIAECRKKILRALDQSKVLTQLWSRRPATPET